MKAGRIASLSFLPRSLCNYILLMADKIHDGKLLSFFFPYIFPSKYTLDIPLPYNCFP